MATPFQEAHGYFLIDGVVLCQKYMKRGFKIRRIRRVHSRRFCRLLQLYYFKNRCEVERAAAVFFTLDPNPSLHQFN